MCCMDSSGDRLQKGGDDLKMTDVIEWASAQVPPTPLIEGGVLQRERGRRTARQTYGRLLLKQREVAPCGQMDTDQLELRQARKGEAVAVLAT